MDDNMKFIVTLAAGALLGYWWARRKPCGCTSAATGTNASTSAATGTSTEAAGSLDWLSGGWR